MVKFSTTDFAINSICSSVPLCFSAFTPQITNRQLSGVYPFRGRIWSMLGENSFAPLPRSPSSNGIWDTSHFPVHRASAHSCVSSKTIPNFLHRAFAALNITTQGRAILDACFRSILRILALSLFSACHARLFFAAFSRSPGASLAIAFFFRTSSAFSRLYDAAFSLTLVRYDSSSAYLLLASWRIFLWFFIYKTMRLDLYRSDFMYILMPHFLEQHFWRWSLGTKGLSQAGHKIVMLYGLAYLPRLYNLTGAS
jgi:hypothetical protein